MVRRLTSWVVVGTIVDDGFVSVTHDGNRTIQTVSDTSSLYLPHWRCTRAAELNSTYNIPHANITATANFLCRGRLSRRTKGIGAIRMTKVQSMSKTAPERLTIFGPTQEPSDSPCHCSQKWLMGVHWKMLNSTKPKCNELLTINMVQNKRRAVPMAKIRMKKSKTDVRIVTWHQL